ncbi:hypothetical protein [Streptomyces microflavus]|uniref:hypothetical protein n=1 Tax=Streptomyces microflavus TaxID=1919 RepID=UPI0036E7DCFD
MSQQQTEAGDRPLQSAAELIGLAVFRDVVRGSGGDMDRAVPEFRRRVAQAADRGETWAIELPLRTEA